MILLIVSSLPHLINTIIYKCRLSHIIRREPIIYYKKIKLRLKQEIFYETDEIFTYFEMNRL